MSHTKVEVVRISNAIKEYRSKNEKDKTIVLKKLNMNVTVNSIYSLIGPSGCGKTTIISSIVGIVSLDRGTVEIFGAPPMKNSTRIGYMPQENALVEEFSIREMIWFFGTVFGMSSKKIDERFHFLTELLELPDGDTFIRNCSGGQQRRVSFAVTLVHEPELLILDEPTVGLDPLLRIKIWDYLLEITSKKQATVLLTTHYVEEASQSTHIGLMRNGVLIAEDSPQKILLVTSSVNLEEAFLKLSERKIIQNENVLDCLAINETAVSPNALRNALVSTCRQTNSKILLALIFKSFLQLYRNIDILLIAIFVPVIGCMSYALVLGPCHGMPFGIVNYEVPLQEDCSNASVRIDGMDCLLPRLSCKIIEAIPADSLIKKFYTNFDEAFEDAKKGRINGILQFSPNFTEKIAFLSDDEEIDLNDNGIIKVYPDYTEFLPAYYAGAAIKFAMKEAFKGEMTRCGLNKKITDMPIVFEAFEELSVDLKPSLASAITVCAQFGAASQILVCSINYDRLGGIWNRSLAAGVRPAHFLIANLIEGFVIMLCQFFIAGTSLLFFSGATLLLKATVQVVLLLLVNGIAGLSFGLLCASIFKSPQNSIYNSQFFIYILFYISGVVWPLEGAPIILQFISRLFPLTNSLHALRSIFAKEVNFTDRSYYNAVLVLLAWIVACLFFCFWKLRRRN